MKSLKQHWADMKARSAEKKRLKEGYEQLCQAIVVNDLDKAKKLLGEGISPGRKFKMSQYNPMALSVAKGSEEMTELLLKNGGDPRWDVYDSMIDIGYTITPYLDLAISHGNEGAAIALAKDKRTDINAVSEHKVGDKKSYGDKAIDRAREKGMAGLLSVLAAREAEVVRAHLKSLEDEAAGKTPPAKAKLQPVSRRKSGDPGPM